MNPHPHLHTEARTCITLPTSPAPCTLRMLRMLCRTMIWQGAEDKSVPVSHAQWWSRKIPGAKLTVLEGEGHVTVLLRFSKVILDAALHWRPQDTAAAEA